MKMGRLRAVARKVPTKIMPGELDSDPIRVENRGWSRGWSKPVGCNTLKQRQKHLAKQEVEHGRT